MRIIHAKIYTMGSLGVLEDGFIQIEQGKISALGAMAECPSFPDEIYDAKGRIALPGLVDAHTHLGMFEDSLGFEGDDGNEETDPCTPHLRALDAVNPLDKCFREALEAGVTTVVTGPGSANPVAGQMVAMKTHGCCVDEMVFRAPLAMKFALGENPKAVYNGKNQMPVTRMAIAALIREQLMKAKRYGEDLRKAQEDEELDPPEYDARCEAMLPLFDHRMQAHFHAHRLDDIYTAIRIAKEFGLEAVIVHGTQGHLAASRLAQEGYPILCGPLLCDRSKPELGDLTPAGVGILSRSGVSTAIITDHSVIPIQYLPICAGLAVRYGMDAMEALKAITIRPAEICRIDDRVGSLEAGKDGDVVIFDELPLTIAARAMAVFSGGEQVK